MKSEIGMGYKLVVFEDNYHTRIETEVTGFSDTSDVISYRDGSEYAGKPSEIQIDYDNYLDSKPQSVGGYEVSSEDDGQTPEPKRQVVQYYERAPFSLGKFLLALVIVAVAIFLLSPVIMFILFPPV